MPTVVASDIEIHYEERGEGAPLLLIGGIPAIASDWAPLAERLAARRRVIAYDNRGSGGSTVTSGSCTTAQLADDAVGLLDHLGVERSDVFGMSLGGMICQELALRHPERVGCLVLGCTHASFAHAIQPPKETGRAFAMQTDDWAERMRALAPLAFARDVDASLLERFTEKKSRDVQDPAGYRAHIDAVLHHDALDRLGAIRAPTLVITGDDDRIVPGVNSEVLAQRIPGATLEVIGGAGHLFFLERPERTVAVLESFLDGSGSAMTATATSQQ
ncbi:MAG TPA: alpha/beta fold hydrolase [Solirubrobacteraceae bacterium]|nr:alpha/beta fold hydrolase [Solirubrobacteraceae bacterium]